MAPHFFTRVLQLSYSQNERLLQPRHSPTEMGRCAALTTQSGTHSRMVSGQPCATASEGCRRPLLMSADRLLPPPPVLRSRRRYTRRGVEEGLAELGGGGGARQAGQVEAQVLWNGEGK